MKQHSEQKTEQAVCLLLQTIERNLQDIGTILNEYEATHDDSECGQSRQYAALTAGQFALEEAKYKINYQLNKK